MADIVKVYTQKLPSSRFVGKKYREEDKVDGTYAHLWGQWFQNGWFEPLESQITEKYRQSYEDFDAYIGLMYCQTNSYEYWIGMFLPSDAKVPEGFESIDFPETDLGVCWVYGKEPEIYCMEEASLKELQKRGYALDKGPDDIWVMERYGCPRFTNPDEQGNVILDICIVL